MKPCTTSELVKNAWNSFLNSKKKIIHKILQASLCLYYEEKIYLLIISVCNIVMFNINIFEDSTFPLKVTQKSFGLDIKTASHSTSLTIHPGH